jgi:transposase InsO family protein
VRVDQLIGSYRMSLMAVVESAGSIRAGCKQVGIHPSTFYDSKSRLESEGVIGLTPRASRTRAKSYARVRLEAEVVAFALANPPFGPDRAFWELQARGVAVGSPSQVWRILCAHHLNTRALRYRMIAVSQGMAITDAMALPGRDPDRAKPSVGKLWAKVPGDLVQLDCFQIGKLKEARLGPRRTPGMVWQYTAIDVASSFTWAQLHTTARNPSAIHTTALAMRVADDLARWGWDWKRATTDRGNEFVHHRFGQALTNRGVEHRLIAPGRPQSNGKVEQVQNTILQECWLPSFVSYNQPSITGLRQDLDNFLDDYNHKRPHGGKWNNGTPPANIIIPNTGNMP